MLDFLYASAANGRRRWYERHPHARRRLQRPVISIGNLSVGGTGKTPLVGSIAEWLIAEGERPAILSRGYKRSEALDGVVVVSDGKSILSPIEHAGDEPLMLAHQVRGAIVCVCEDRHLAGAVAERKLGATVHLLDDGFQHVQLARDLDILVTSVGEITNGYVVPRGRLREPRSAAARADFVVVVDADDAAARTEAWELGISQFARARRRLNETGAPRTERLIAFAGIGNPAQFFLMLRDAGYDVADTITFRDHHGYTTADVAAIRAAVTAAGGAGAVTTAKDAIRLEAFGALPFVLYVMPMALELEDWTALRTTIRAVIDSRRHLASGEPS